MNRLITPVLLVLVFHATAMCSLKESVKGPHHLSITLTSAFDGSAQPYRVHLPSACDGKSALPLLVALRGTGGDQNKYIDHRDYHNGINKTEAEKRGIIVLSPPGADAEGLPTKWRGEAEIYLLAGLEHVRRRFRIDPERIVCTSSAITRADTWHLGDLFGKLDHEFLEPALLSTAWRFTLKHNGRINAKLDGRVIEVVR